MRPFSGDVSRIKLLCKTMDNEHEDFEMLNSMYASMPTSSEIKDVQNAIKVWQGKFPDKHISELPAADRYVNEVGDIENVSDHLKVMVIVMLIKNLHNHTLNFWHFVSQSIKSCFFCGKNQQFSEDFRVCQIKNEDLIDNKQQF